jgi:hypothetical protein
VISDVFDSADGIDESDSAESCMDIAIYLPDAPLVDIVMGGHRHHDTIRTGSPDDSTWKVGGAAKRVEDSELDLPI